MNKLVLATTVATALGGAVFGASNAIESQNIVGYQSKSAAEAGLRYITPSFGKTDGSDNTVHDLQMDSSVATGSANIQFLDKDGISTARYVWVEKSVAEKYNLEVPSGANGVWAVQSTTYDPIEETSVTTYSAIDDEHLAIGQAIVLQVEGGRGATVLSSGKVMDTDPSITSSVAGLMYVGNPFAQEVSIHAFQMGSSVVTGSANIQFLDKDGISTARYVWVEKSVAEKYNLEVPSGANGVWAAQSTTYDPIEETSVTTYSAINVKVAAGDGLQLECGAGATVKILAPYSL